MKNKMIIKNYINAVIGSCKSISYSEIINIYDMLIKTNDIGGKIFICGNGGSASTASHFQTDLNKAFSIAKEAMPAISLVDNLSTLTATANDYLYDDVFIYQLKYLLKEKDILIGISGSGNSNNVIKAAEYAKRKGSTVISFVGFDGGKLKAISDYSLHVPINNMQVSEDLHMLFCHLVSIMIKESKGKTND